MKPAAVLAPILFALLAACSGAITEPTEWADSPDSIETVVFRTYDAPAADAGADAIETVVFRTYADAPADAGAEPPVAVAN
jgi:hypothetical protein